VTRRDWLRGTAQKRNASHRRGVFFTAAKRTRHGTGTMTNKIHLFTAAALTLPAASQAQQSEPTSRQPILQRGDPATVGAGPTSSAPGQTNYDPPRGASVTTDDRGVTTTNSAGEDSKSKGVRPDRGNESNDVAAPDGK
jgi:hypothetical protein